MQQFKNAIVVLGGGLVKEKGKWRTTNFSDKGDKFGALGDRLRIVAASYLYKDNPEQIIIASGGRGQIKAGSDEPAVATVIKKELEGLAVPANKIIKETKSKNTYTELIELQKIIKEKGLKRITIISNKYHLPRLEAIIKHCPELIRLKKMFAVSKLTLKSAEEILIKYDSPNWQKTITKAYKNAGMKERIKLERKGVKDIKMGKYKFK
jgi:hypothetical protein